MSVNNSRPVFDATSPLAEATALLAEAARRTDAALERFLPRADVPPTRLHEAMRYSIFAGGKRLRPALVLGAFRAACSAAKSPNKGQTPATGLAAAIKPGPDPEPAMAAVESLHTYTLIHDDLPAMDDDDLRRGRPTCHKAFDEATAILAGDALHTLAFEMVAEHGAEAVRVLARAAGSLGVIGGQQDDLDAEGQPISNDAQSRARLERIHRGKTAALIRASCELGALVAGANDGDRHELVSFGDAIGLAFQIADDILDATADAATLGKTPGKDAAHGKWTYVALYGLEAARSEATRLEQRALQHLSRFGARAESLAQLARFVVQRDH